MTLHQHMFKLRKHSDDDSIGSACSIEIEVFEDDRKPVLKKSLARREFLFRLKDKRMDMFLHATVLLLRSYSVISAFLSLAAQMSAYFILQPGAIHSVLYFYTTSGDLLLIINEAQLFELDSMTSKWISRGILYSFLGLITLEQIDEVSFSEETRLLELANKVAAWLIISSACFYLLLCCFSMQVLFFRHLCSEGMEQLNDEETNKFELCEEEPDI